MKKSFLKIISLLLTIASLVSMLAIFAWAEEASDVEENPPVAEDLSTLELMYERDFEEGWEVENGFVMTKNGHNMYVDYEELSDYSYNYFARFEATDAVAKGTADLQFGARVAREKSTIVSFSVKADDAASFSGPILSMKSGTKVDRDILFISDKKVYAFVVDQKHLLGDISDNGWLDVTIVFDWSDPTKYQAKAYVGEEFDLSAPVATVSQSNGNLSDGSPKTDTGLLNLFISIPNPGSVAGAKVQDGMSFCLDNLQVYQGVVNPVKRELIAAKGPGINIDPLAPKTVDIKEGSDAKTTEQLLKEALCMKLDVPYALMRDEKIALSGDYCVPTKVNGEIVVSLELILRFIGYPYYTHPDGQSFDITTGLSSTYITVGRDTASVNGELVDLTLAPGYLEGTDKLVIAMKDIPVIFSGWLLTYDEMGLILMYEDTTGGEGGDLITREKDLATMLEMMKRFVFDITADDTLDADALYKGTGSDIFEDVKANTNNFQHPYIYANQSDFDALKNSFGGDDEKLNSYIQAIVDTAKGYYDETAELDGDNNYAQIKEGMEPLNVYSDGKRPTGPLDLTVDDTDNGYSPKGDLYELEAITEKLVYLAFAYQVTGDVNYAKLAYDMSIIIGEWIHWAPGYMVNCATATGNIAVSYDWLYNAYLELYGKDGVDAIAEIIYNKGVIHGYNASAGIACEFARPSGTGDHYITRTDNWNAACASGMIIGSLAIMENDKYRDTTDYLIGNNIQNLAKYGLDQYAPDGSYIESATYWAIGTNGLMKLVMALDSAAGTSYGFKDTWGLNSSFYYAIHIETNAGDAWNYHDDGVGSIIDGTELGVDTQMFNFAGYLFKDNKLFEVRESQIEKGKKLSIFDVLYYPGEYEETYEDLALDYEMAGLDAFVTRSDWDEDGIYAGIMGGANSFSPYTTKDTGDDQFGQLDSGNFIYANNGTTWFMDLGSDYYGAYNYFGSYRYRYYRNSAEGQNVLFFTSKQTTLPNGMDAKGEGKLIESYIDDAGEGSYAIIDNAGVYGSYVLSAKRGMLLFNDRKTVVIQDEVSMNNSFEDVVWVAHTAHRVEVDSTGRTAYLYHEDDMGFLISVIRVSIVSAASSLKFEAASASTPILKDTIKNDPNEISRDDITKLVIRANGVLGLNLAVVIEEVESAEDSKNVAYTWTDLDSWKDVFSQEIVDDGLVRRGKAVRTDIVTETLTAEVIFDSDYAFEARCQDYYTALTNVAYTLKTFAPSTFGPTDLALLTAYEDYQEFEEEFDAYADYVNECMDDILNGMNVFTGIDE